MLENYDSINAVLPANIRNSILVKTSDRLLHPISAIKIKYVDIDAEVHEDTITDAQFLNDSSWVKLTTDKPIGGVKNVTIVWASSRCEEVSVQCDGLKLKWLDTTTAGEIFGSPFIGSARGTHQIPDDLVPCNHLINITVY